MKTKYHMISTSDKLYLDGILIKNIQIWLKTEEPQNIFYEDTPICSCRCHKEFPSHEVGKPCPHCLPLKQEKSWTKEELERDAKEVAKTFTPEELGVSEPSND